MPQTQFIVGITGTLGAGKGTVAEILQLGYGFRHYSVRTFLTRGLKLRKREINRDTMTELANELRATYGANYIVRELYRSAQKSGCSAVIESIRTVGEINYLRTLPNFVLIGVDASLRTRYRRIRKRASATDAVKFRQFYANEQRELESTDSKVQNLSACLTLCDELLTNNGTRAQFGSAVVHAMGRILSGTSKKP